MRRVTCDGCGEDIKPAERESLYVVIHRQSVDGDTRDALDLHCVECLRRRTVGRQNDPARSRALEGADGAR